VRCPSRNASVGRPKDWRGRAVAFRTETSRPARWNRASRGCGRSGWRRLGGSARRGRLRANSRSRRAHAATERYPRIGRRGLVGDDVRAGCRARAARRGNVGDVGHEAHGDRSPRSVRSEHDVNARSDRAAVLQVASRGVGSALSGAASKRGSAAPASARARCAPPMRRGGGHGTKAAHRASPRRACARPLERLTCLRIPCEPMYCPRAAVIPPYSERPEVDNP